MMTNMMKQMMVMTITWKLKSSTVRFVRMFDRCWTGFFQNRSFEPVRMNFGWWAQWKVTPWRLEMKHHRTVHLPLSWPASSATRSPDPPLPPADLKNEDFQWTVVTNAKSEKTIPSDTDIPCTDDADEAKSADHEIHLLREPVLWECYTDPGQDSSGT